tara:strand:- start:1583 stop:1819 length:237 start_codon:yes stop_codon:yes gene_type:complete
MIQINGFEEAIIGEASSYSRETVLAYSMEKMVAILMGEQKMNETESTQYIEDNILNSYHGEGMPVFITETDPEILSDV